MKFSIKDFFSDQIRRFPEDLVTFTEEILNGKTFFVQCSVRFNAWKQQKEEVGRLAIYSLKRGF